MLELAGDVDVDVAAVRAADAMLARAGELGLAAGDFSQVAEVLRHE